MREVEHAERAVDDGQAGLISASNAPSASPLKTCETKLGQLIMNAITELLDRRTRCEYSRKKRAPQAVNRPRRAKILI